MKLVQDWRALRHALHADYEAVSVAVQQSWEALGFSSEEHLMVDELVLSAVAQSAEALRFASPSLRGNADFIRKAVKLDGRAIHYALPELQSDRSLVLQAVQQNSWAIDCIPEELRRDPEFMLEVVSNNPAALRFAPAELREHSALKASAAAASAALPIQPARRKWDNQELAGRWRYCDDMGTDDEDFVIILSATLPRSKLEVHFLFEGQETAAKCSGQVAGDQVTIIEEEQGTRNSYIGTVEQGGLLIRGTVRCETSGRGNTFEEGSVGSFIMQRLLGKDP